jgi:hypothetical protein
VRKPALLFAVTLIAIALCRQLAAQNICESCYFWVDTGNPHLFQYQAQCCFSGSELCDRLVQDYGAGLANEGSFCDITPMAEGYNCGDPPPCTDNGGTGGGAGGCTVSAGEGCPAECSSCNHQAY